MYCYSFFVADHYTRVDKPYKLSDSVFAKLNPIYDFDNKLKRISLFHSGSITFLHSLAEEIALVLLWLKRELS